MRNSRILVVAAVSVILILSSAPLQAGVVKVSNVSAERQSPTQHFLHASLENTAEISMEALVRSELAFYDRNSPPGDLPVSVLKKDQTLFLHPQEIRKLDVKFIEEAAPASLPLRIQPLVRIRREREWKY